ncbi:MAG: hypothetical protein EOS75_30055 [Mesorhizobium sp.]|nr:MAG: hypothetical protein EOS74_10750 [Mesorhizobium sp.]RWD52221.1 MAG: hypothetical protein EOS75_30055 [Mesorhizobium sp.]
MEAKTFWTVLPNGIVNGRARLSVFVTPKLGGQVGDLQALSDYPDMLDWPDLVKDIGFRLYARPESGGDAITKLAGGMTFYPTNKGEFALAPRVWEHLFKSRPILVEPEPAPDDAEQAPEPVVGVQYRAAFIDRIVGDTQTYHMMRSLASLGEEPQGPAEIDDQGQIADRLARLARLSQLKLEEFPQRDGDRFFYRSSRAVTNFFRENQDGDASATVDDLASNDALLTAQYNAFALYHRHGVRNRNYRIRRPFGGGDQFVEFNFSETAVKTITAGDDGGFFEFAERLDVLLPSLAEVPDDFAVTFFFAPDEGGPEGLSEQLMEERLPRRGLTDQGGVEFQPMSIGAATGDAFANGARTAVMEAFRGLKISKSSRGVWASRPLEQQDFHAIVSGLASYPIVMRRIGMLFDIEAETDDFPTLSGRFELIVEPVFSEAANVPGRPDFSANISWSVCSVGEVTTTTESGTSFRSFAMAPKEPSDRSTLAGFQVLNDKGLGRKHAIGHSFQDIDSAAYKIVQKSVADGAPPDPHSADKILNPFVYERRVLAPGSPKAASRDGQGLEIEGTFRQPASRSTGISLFLDQDGRSAIRRFNEQLPLSRAPFNVEPQAPTPGELATAPLTYRDDVTAGLKIDVHVAGPKMKPEDQQWYSLTARQLKLNFLNNTTLGQYLAPADEAWVEKAGTSEVDEGGTTQLRVNDYSFRWDQWSLSAPHPSRPAPELGDGGDQWERSVELTVQSETVALSLAKLRYGRTYTFRARVADIAGNAVHSAYATAGMPNPTSELAKKVATEPIVYRRYDPISPPVLYALQPPGPGSKKTASTDVPVGPDKGDILVIRSGKSIPTKLGEADWLVLPPDTDFQEAEWAGMLDGFSRPDDAYDVLVRYSGKLPEDYKPDFLKSIRWPNGRLGTPYLPDGYAAGATFQYLPGAGRKEREAGLPFAEKAGAVRAAVTQVSFNLNATIPNGKKPFSEPFRIHLENGKRATSKNSAGLSVSLPPGEQQLVVVSCYPDPNRLDDFESVSRALSPDSKLLVQMVSQAVSSLMKENKNELVLSLSAGLHYPITPSKTIRMIHAVPKPVQTPKFSPALRVTNRVTGGNAVVLEDAAFALHRVSTGKIDIFAEWDEYLDIPGDTVFPRTRHERRHCFAVDVPLPDTTIDPDPSHFAFDLGGRHGFPSNQHLQVKYRAVATTRYKEYFDEKVTDDPANLTVESDPSCDLDILNTAPPPPPQVLYILPLFLWERQEGKAGPAGGSTTNIRRRAGFRIYMRRGWYRSGKDEQLAIILQSEVPGAANAGDDPAPIPVTHWGSDPIWHDRNPIRRQPRLRDCLSATALVKACPAPAEFDKKSPAIPQAAVTQCGDDVTPCVVSARDGVILPAPVLPIEIETAEGDDRAVDNRRAADGYGPDLAPEQELRVDVAAHIVNLDAARDVLYADVELADVGAYTPFVRFALARYQRHSAKYCCLSPISLVDYLQINPERTISIVRSAGGKAKSTVTVSGPAKGDLALGQSENILRVYRVNDDDVLEQYPMEVMGKWLAPSEGPAIFQWEFEVATNAKTKHFLEEVEILPGGERIIFSEKVDL